MSKIKSFLDWNKDKESEYQIRLRESFDELCEEEIKMMETIRDISLGYQDSGASFYFIIRSASRNTIYTSENSDDWKYFGYKLIDTLINCLNGEERIITSIESRNLSEKSYLEFEKEVMSYLGDDWSIRKVSLPEREIRKSYFQMDIHKK